MSTKLVTDALVQLQLRQRVLPRKYVTVTAVVKGVGREQHNGFELLALAILSERGQVEQERLGRRDCRDRSAIWIRRNVTQKG